MAREFSETKAFTRKRSLGFKEVVSQYLAMNIEGSEFGQEIISKTLFNRSVHRSSLSRAKQKIAPELFSELLRRQSQSCHERWHGHIVRAVDGTSLTLPLTRDILTTFAVREAEHYPRALLVTASDVFTGLPNFASIGEHNTSERDHLLTLLENSAPGDITLLDRGYEGKEIWSAFNQRDQYFVARLTTRNSKRSLYQRIFRSASKELVVDVELGGERQKLRLIKQASKTGHLPLVIVTNLVNKKRYKRAELIGLYKRRWQAETLYYRIKQYLGIQSWHCKKAQGVLREILANLLSLAIIARQVYEATQKLKKRLESINFKNAIFVVRYALIRPISMKELRRKLLSCRCSKQPGRSYPRRSMQPHNKWIHHRKAREEETAHWGAPS
jgi:hypothetical protein